MSCPRKLKSAGLKPSFAIKVSRIFGSPVTASSWVDVIRDKAFDARKKTEEAQLAMKQDNGYPVSTVEVSLICQCAKGA